MGQFGLEIIFTLKTSILTFWLVIIYLQINSSFYEAITQVSISHQKSSALYITQIFSGVLPTTDFSTQPLPVHQSNFNSIAVINNMFNNKLLNKAEREWLVQHPKINLAIGEHWPPLNFIKNGKMVGYNIDLLAQINANLGTEFKIVVYDDWLQSLDDVRNNKLDGLFGFSRTAERELEFNFSPVYFFAPIDIVVPSDNQEIDSLSSLNHKTVLTFKGYAINNIIRDKAPDAKLRFISSKKHAINKLLNNEADAAIFSLAASVINDSAALRISQQIYSKTGGYTIGTAKNNPIFSEIIKKGLDSITQQQLKIMDNKWLKFRVNNKIFTDEEQQYIDNRSPINIGVEPWAPIIFSLETRPLSGIVGDILQEISHISGLKMVAVAKPWHELTLDFNAGKIDILPSTVKLKDRLSWGEFSDNYLQLFPRLYVNESNSEISSLTDLSDKTIAVVRGSHLLNILKSLPIKPNIVYTTGVAQSISLVAQGKVDAMIGIDLAVQERFNQIDNSRLKPIFTHEILPFGLSMLTPHNDPILASIINKSLHFIPPHKKRQIKNAWRNTATYNKKISLGLINDLPPYVLENSPVKGMAYDLIARALALNNIDIVNTQHFSSSELHKKDHLRANLDAFIASQPNVPDLFYSDKFLQFENIVVSRIDRKFIINESEDLIDKRVIAFKGARQQLGPEFSRVFNQPSNANKYSELKSQQQVKEFLQGNADLLIIDKRIFIWLVKQSGISSLSAFKFDYLFPRFAPTRIAFKDSQLRDVFNKNLNIMRSSGEYQNIINDYLSNTIIAKDQLVELTASLIAQSLYRNTIENLKQLVSKLRLLPHIKDITINNSAGINQVAPLTNMSSHLMRQASYYFINNTPQNVGNISIEFNEIELQKAITNSSVIPALNHFSELTDYPYIRLIYDKYNYLDQRIALTVQELNYLANNPILRFSESDWQPLIIVNNGEFSGLLADYMAIVAKKIGVEFQFVPADSWPQAQEMFTSGKIDFLPYESVPIGEHLLSDKFVEFNYAIVTRQEGSFITNLSELHGLTVAVPTSYASYTLLKEQHPTINIIGTQSTIDALTLVRHKKADAYVGHMVISVNQIKQRFPDLKIAGISEQRFQHHFLINKKHALLVPIFNKAIASISMQQRQEIRDKWFTVKVSDKIDYSLLYQAILIFSVILLIALYVVRFLFKANQRATRSNEQLNETVSKLVQTQTKLTGTINHLEETKEQLIAAEKMASLGGLVAGIAHEINTPVGIGLTGITHFQMITDELTKKYNAKTMAKKDFELYLETASEAASLIHNNLEKTADLVRSFKQISVDQSSDEMRHFNLSEYIDETLVSIISIIKNPKLDISTQCEQDIFIYGYPGAISQIVSNLVINASIHAFTDNESGSIKIIMTQTEGLIHLTFIDNGAGISDEIQPKIFDPFFTTNRENGGSGLGLNIIFNVVTNQLKGSIKCKSKLGQGTTFAISFKTNKSQPTDLT